MGKIQGSFIPEHGVG